MNHLILKTEYLKKKSDIERALQNFESLSTEQQYLEFLFCILTPQSNASKCWSAVQDLYKLNNLKKEKVTNILKSKTRFHNNKTIYIINASKTWVDILPILSEKDRFALRNEISEKVRGYGLKESSHFLRNIGKSDNQIAILDRHILRNLLALGIISDEDTRIKNKKHYFEIERKFINFSEDIDIPIDHLDLLFWSRETGEIFK